MWHDTNGGRGSGFIRRVRGISEGSIGGKWFHEGGCEILCGCHVEVGSNYRIENKNRYVAGTQNGNSDVMRYRNRKLTIATFRV